METKRWKPFALQIVSIVTGTVVFTACIVNSALAIPSFSRKYQTSCVTCHYAYPQLNGFGKAFRNNGYRYPGDDQDMVKEDPVSLGNKHYKEIWPNAVWPSDIPGNIPVAIRAVGRFSWDQYAAPGVASNTFELPHEMEVLYGGTIGDDFSFFGEIEFENENNDVETAFPFRLEWNLNPLANLIIGSMNADPTPDHHRLTKNHYNVASFRSRDGLRLRGDKSGLGFWGAVNGVNGKGGLYYKIGLSNGQGINDNNSDKDFFAQARYKIGGLGQVGGTEGQESDTSAFYEDDHLSLGGFTYIGTAGPEGTNKEDVTMYGGTLDWWYRRAILNATVLGMNSSIDGVPDRTSVVWYAQGQFVIYPWLIGLARIESTDKDTDDAVTARYTLIPGIVSMIRANVRATLEYKVPTNDHHMRKSEEGLVFQVDFAL